MMNMNPRERIMAVLTGEEPDMTPVCAYDMLRVGPQGGWVRRLAKRGLGILRFAAPYKPAYFHPMWINPYLEDVKYIQIHYKEKGVTKFRHTFETPIGSITGVVRLNPLDVTVNLGSQEEPFVKERSDWHIVNHIFKGIIDNLTPDYDALEREEDELGDTGITCAFVDKTPWQRAWVELASLERAVIDFHEQCDEIREYIEIQTQLHTRQAEIAAESPVKFINIPDNTTDFTSPKYYREYCIRIYDIYNNAFKGTDKVLGIHMDGRFGSLRKEVADAPFKVVDSFTVPPTGDISLTEAKALWPDKILFVNAPPHLAWAEPEEVRKGYEALAEEWGSKKGLLFEHSEDLPLEKVESHLSAALDAFGY
jgi:uroporphyrinogen-III decarboxylase